MRSLLIAFLIGCTASPPATDRLDCYSCHQTEYDNERLHPQLTVSACTKKPVHDPTLGYTTNCYTCHGTITADPDPDPMITRSGWCPAIDPPPTASDPAPHNVFNIATGSHTGFDCGNCHAAPGLVAGVSLTSASIPLPLQCTTCHWHDQAQTDPRHVGKSGYSYGPATCLASECHGRGRGVK
jgi:hypothetical protein